jgi:[ribosomal protein S5]-alanine N-acetyltransferase
MDILETVRLRLRELSSTDLDFVATMMGDEEVTRYYGRRFSRSDAELWIEQQRERYREDGHGLWLVLALDGGMPIGQVGLMLQEVEGTAMPEVAWLLHRPFWGHGYATEAAAATRDAAFTLWQYEAVVSLIRPENVPSQKVARRIGMHPGRLVQFEGFEHIVFQVGASASVGTSRLGDRWSNRSSFSSWWL